MARRPILALALLGCIYQFSQSFVGTPSTPRDLSRVPARVSAEYLERLGPKDSDVPFDGTSATGPGAAVEFKKRPFGILRYQPGNGMKGAMAMEIIPKSRYPGDPQGQAFASGVQSGWVVASINGQNVLSEDFGKIMDLLDDEVADPRFSKSTALALEKQGGRMAEPAAAPLQVTFASIPGYVYKGAELKEVPIPGLKFQKVPLKLLSLGYAASAEGGLEKGSLTGFPYSTDNSAALLLALPRLGGRMTLGLDAPAVGGDSDDSGHMELDYEQRLPGDGLAALKMKTNGEWGASFLQEVEDVGVVSGALNSQLDWNLDLNQTYDAVRGFVPTVAYGATQDGLRVRARVAKAFSPSWFGSYGLQNIPGKYSPVDFVHDSTVTFSKGAHTIQAAAAYDRQLLKSPLTGSLSYALRTRIATLYAALDSQQYRLAVAAGHKQMTASLGRKNEDGLRPSWLELRLGKVAATLSSDGSSKPRLRLSKQLR
ncbi:unnamed protein product [Effrenium voratum]|nr:unnamed protein product [Effrenium voratum]